MRILLSLVGKYHIQIITLSVSNILWSLQICRVYLTYTFISRLSINLEMFN